MTSLSNNAMQREREASGVLLPDGGAALDPTNGGRAGVLDMDPHTQLPIISVPADRRVAFSDLQDVVLHVFVDCYKVTTSNQLMERVLVITDQTVLLCGRDGSCSRCVLIDRIECLAVNVDPTALAMVIPAEFDMLFKFFSPEDRDRVVKTLRSIYIHKVYTRLEVKVHRTSHFDPSLFNTKKPATFRLTLIPQRTREQLRQALVAHREERAAMVKEVDAVKVHKNEQHDAEMAALDEKLHDLMDHYRAATHDYWSNISKIKKLREDVLRAQRLIEEVDGGIGPEGEVPMHKDALVGDLELVGARLNAASYFSGSEQLRRNMDDHLASSYFQQDVQNALYQPGIASGGLTTADLQSQLSALSERLHGQDAHIAELKDIIDERAPAEARLTLVKEKITFITHLLKNEKSFVNFVQDRVSTSGGAAVSGGGSGLMVYRRGDSTSLLQTTTNIGGPLMDEFGFEATLAGESGAISTLHRKKMEEWVEQLPDALSEETLTFDPRSGLKFVAIPAQIADDFKSLQGRGIHFVSIVRKFGTGGMELEKRVLIISDVAIFLATIKGEVKRYVEIQSIDSILNEGPSSARIGFRCRDNFDLLISCNNASHRAEVETIVSKIIAFHTGGFNMPITVIEPPQKMEAHLNLRVPADYIVPAVRLTSRRDLVRKVQQKRDVLVQNLYGGAGGPQFTDNEDDHPPEGFSHVSPQEWRSAKARMKKKMEEDFLRKDPLLVGIRESLQQKEQQLAQLSNEKEELKKKFESHRCEVLTRQSRREEVEIAPGTFPLTPGSGLIPKTNGVGLYRPEATGLIFIQVDPVQINCLHPVRKLSFVGDFLFTGHPNGLVQFWDLAAMKVPGEVKNNEISRQRALQLGLHEHTAAITDIAVASPSLFYTASLDGTVRIWDLNRNAAELASAAAGGSNKIWSDKFSKKKFSTVIKNRSALDQDLPHLSSVHAIAAYQNDLLVGGSDKILRIWDLEKLHQTYELPAHEAPILGVKRCGNEVVTIDWGGLHMWDLRHKKPVRSIKDTTGGITCIALNEHNIVCGKSNGDIMIWEKGGFSGETILGHSSDVIQLQFAGRSAISSGMDYKVKMWDIGTGTCIADFDESYPHETSCFQMQERRFVAGQGNFVQIWEK